MQWIERCRCENAAVHNIQQRTVLCDHLTFIALWQEDVMLCRCQVVSGNRKQTSPYLRDPMRLKEISRSKEQLD